MTESEQALELLRRKRKRSKYGESGTKDISGRSRRARMAMKNDQSRPYTGKDVIRHQAKQVKDETAVKKELASMEKSVAPKVKTQKPIEITKTPTPRKRGAPKTSDAGDTGGSGGGGVKSGAGAAVQSYSSGGSAMDVAGAGLMATGNPVAMGIGGGMMVISSHQKKKKQAAIDAEKHRVQELQNRRTRISNLMAQFSSQMASNALV